MEPSAGIEPAVSVLPRRCFTTKLRRRWWARVRYSIYCAGTYQNQVRNLLRSDKEITGPADSAGLSIPCRHDSQRRCTARRRLANWDEICALQLRAVYAEKVYLADVRLKIRSRSMSVRAAAVPLDCAFAKPAGLNLDTRQDLSIVNQQIISSVFAKRLCDEVPRASQLQCDEHFGEIADAFGVAEKRNDVVHTRIVAPQSANWVAV
jgi:hypothetical protein